jgi:predicted NBD/HSP70 family sugar kinase
MRPNQRRVLAVLARRGEASRAELASELDLPKATVAGIVTALIERGRLIETTRALTTAGPGRPGQVVALAGPVPAIGMLTWEAGSLQVTIASLDGRVLAEGAEEAGPETPPQDALDLTLNTLATAAGDAGYQVTDLAAVVLSLPAPFQRGVDSAARVPAFGAIRRWEWLPAWLEAGLAIELGRRTGVPALVENDANLGALGEYTFGAGQGKLDQVYIKLGRNSVGAGLILGGRLHRGATGVAGELAHVQVMDDGPLCACGGRGCLIRVIGSDMLDLAQPAYEQTLTFANVLSLAGAGDVGLQRLLADLGRAIGRPLADLCTMLNPELFILDGSVGQAGDHIVNGMAEAVDRHARPATAASLRVAVGELGAHAEVLGSVALARHERARALVNS